MTLLAAAWIAFGVGMIGGFFLGRHVDERGGVVVPFNRSLLRGH